MNKKICALLCAIAMVPSVALADASEIDGEIRAAKTRTIRAPYGGRVSDFSAEMGDALRAGEVLLELETTKLYAEMDGTVKAVFAEAGDSAAAVQARYGSLMSIEQELLYEAQCTISGASGKDNKVVHPGEIVYLATENSSTRKGVGRVTDVTGTSYRVEITDDGNLRVGDVARIYRDDDHDSDFCVGSGSVSRIDPMKVTADGYVLCVYVKEGQSVKRGDLLAEIVPDALEGLRGGSSAVTMPEGGVLLSVTVQSGEQAAKNAVLATYCPDGALEMIGYVEEDELSAWRTGAHVSVTLEAYPNKTIGGTVSKIAFVPNESGDYAVTISLSDTNDLRIGMRASAQTFGNN